MAATGSNHEARHLAQPPRGFQGTVLGRRGLHFPIWAAAVLLLAALAFLVFPATPGSAETASIEAAATDPNAIVVPILFPFENRVTWTDTFGAARSGGRTHAGNDLMAPKMTPILAVVDGKADWLNLTGKLSSYNNLPYYNILLRGDDGNDYFYIHLNNDTPGTDDGLGGVQYAYAPGLTNGTHVHRGDVIGYVGDSGNAEDSVSHLHFEIHLGGYVAASAGQTRTPSAIDPYASLKAAPTLAEWIAAGKPPLTTTTTKPGSTTTTTAPKPTTTTTAPKPTTTTTTVPTTAVPGFTDVRTTDWFYADFAQARAAGVVTEVADQRFRPYSQVSRALFTVYLVRAMAPAERAAFDAAAADAAAGSGAVAAEGGTLADPAALDPALDPAVLQPAPVTDTTAVDPTADPAALDPAATPAAAKNDPIAVSAADGGDSASFTDVPSTYWAYKEIQVAARLGLVRGTGDGTTFSPDQLITRAQMATMMCRALGSDPNENWAGTAAAAYLVYKDVPKGYWAQGAIFMTNYLGLMCGDAKDCFRPEENANRAQAITVMARLLRLLEGGSGS
jgi:murein DD-endopeptidase MepM/ murein hydrolase activator NlpD